MDDWWLAVAGNDETLAAMRLEVFHERRYPGLGGLRHSAGFSATGTERGGERPREVFDLRRLQRQAMVRLRSTVGRRALNGIETTDLTAIGLGATA
jgi:hypothetical protein